MEKEYRNLKGKKKEDKYGYVRIGLFRINSNVSYTWKEQNIYLILL